jgi:predicted esterase
MRILLVHGFTQNSHIVKQKFANTIKLIDKKEKVEWLIPEGTILLDEKNNNRSWYYCNAKNPLDYKPYFDIDIAECIGLETSIELLKKYSDIDVIIGFSQGAQIAHYLIYNNIIVPKKVIFISGFINPWPTKYISKLIDINSLHIYGTSDDVVSNEKSINLQNQYINSKVIIHEKHHILGFNSILSKEIAAWLFS